jgi:methylenetetrahydrofolate dehydrogenase (NADP+)/methenyltetrahydrofolate cyclohydrolase
MNSTLILDGKPVRDAMIAHLKNETLGLVEKPALAVVTVGDDPASKIYVGIKERTCHEIGFGFRKFMFGSDASLADIIACITQLNTDPTMSGIIVQIPLPQALWGTEQMIVSAVDPGKDVDGLHPSTIGAISVKPDIGNDRLLLPPTPIGVVRLLEYYHIPIAGKHVVILGRSSLVGKPLSFLMLSRDATVTVCHTKTEDIASIARTADILISSVGKPHTVTPDMVKPGAVVVDVGIIQLADGVVGDVEYTGVSNVASAITPVPGGVGPMTIACLMENVMKAYRLQHR